MASSIDFLNVSGYRFLSLGALTKDVDNLLFVDFAENKVKSPLFTNTGWQAFDLRSSPSYYMACGIALSPNAGNLTITSGWSNDDVTYTDFNDTESTIQSEQMINGKRTLSLGNNIVLSIVQGNQVRWQVVGKGHRYMRFNFKTPVEGAVVIFNMLTSHERYSGEYIV